MRKVVLVLVTAALAAGYFLLLPPRTAVAPVLPEGVQAPMRGAIHVHTSRSDGTGTIAQVAAAAERAGLDFVILTDHGDGTAVPEPPAYHGRVLVIDAVEISTTAGHVVALGIGKAPYPLGGEARDVAADINRLGGIAIAAHPASAKPELQFSDWQAEVAGLEWLNADSEWRDEGAPQLLRSLLTYPVRRVESVAALFDRPGAALRAWDDLLKPRRAIAVAAPDAHARIGLRTLGEPYDSGVTLRIPSYETMFRALSLAVPGVRATNDARADAATILQAIRAGRFYSRVDAVMQGGTLDFTARSGSRVAGSGETLPLDGPVTLRIDALAPEQAVVVILRDGVEVRRSDGSPIEEVVAAEPAVYRVELRLPGAPGEPPIPWMVSNPIYVGWPDEAQAPIVPAIAPATSNQVLFGDETTTTAKVEQSTGSVAAVDVVAALQGRQLLFRYAVGGRLSDSPYAALALPVRDAGRFTRMSFTARADHASRIAIQLRGPSGERWRRSIYVDETARTFTIDVDDMASVATGRRERPPLDRIDSLLFVADAVNTPLGGSGTIWLDEIRFER